MTEKHTHGVTAEMSTVWVSGYVRQDIDETQNKTRWGWLQRLLRMVSWLDFAEQHSVKNYQGEIFQKGRNDLRKGTEMN